MFMTFPVFLCSFLHLVKLMQNFPKKFFFIREYLTHTPKYSINHFY